MRRNREKLRKIVTASALCAVVMVGHATTVAPAAGTPTAGMEFKGGLRRMVQTLAAQDLAAAQAEALHALTARGGWTADPLSGPPAPAA